MSPLGFALGDWAIAPPRKFGAKRTQSFPFHTVRWLLMVFLHTTALLIGDNWKWLILCVRGCNCFHLARIQVLGVSQNGWQNCLFLSSLAYWKKKRKKATTPSYSLL